MLPEYGIAATGIMASGGVFSGAKPAAHESESKKLIVTKDINYGKCIWRHQEELFSNIGEEADRVKGIKIGFPIYTDRFGLNFDTSRFKGSGFELLVDYMKKYSL
ncbi:hypothetical protein SADUNF_Sadunf03G0133000 [Salix dunnii]|uniref:Uncharacterized protein n=1 Tax=Salix dunnii TaxID=1413687 RepID=A0A835TGI9_9ROSI|nr:hypothetical protein SADUNF_Sadunf03G0133000 [Salix dunnii]